MDEPQKHYPNRKKPDGRFISMYDKIHYKLKKKKERKKPETKGHIWYDFIYMKYPEQVNPLRQKWTGGFQGLGERKNGE